MPHEEAFELIETSARRQFRGKKLSGIRMVVRCAGLCYTKAHVDTFVILSGDSDFSPLCVQNARELTRSTSVCRRTKSTSI